MLGHLPHPPALQFPMPRDDFTPPRDPESKRTGASKRAVERADAERAAAGWVRRGRSGYGSESIRPHLRAQLEYQKLWHPTFPPEAEPDEDADEDVPTR
jgi:hypothetical protein